MQRVNDLKQREPWEMTNQTAENAEWNIKGWDSLGFLFRL